MLRAQAAAGGYIYVAFGMLATPDFRTAYGAAANGWAICKQAVHRVQRARDSPARSDLPPASSACAGALLAALVSLPVGLWSRWCVQSENRCGIAASCCAQSTVSVAQFLVLLTIAGYTAFASGAEECYGRSAGTAGLQSLACREHFRSLAAQRMLRLWLQMHALARGGDERSRQVLVSVEEGNFCCGWGPPEQCAPGNFFQASRLVVGANESERYWSFGAAGEDLLLSDQPVLEGLQRCALRRDGGGGDAQVPTSWYAPSTYCATTTTGDADADIKGCPFQFPVSGSCTAASSTANPGCGDKFAEYVRQAMGPYAAVLAVTFVVGCLSACCTAAMCVCRKREDRLPRQAPTVDPEWMRFGAGYEEELAEEEERLARDPMERRRRRLERERVDAERERTVRTRRAWRRNWLVFGGLPQQPDPAGGKEEEEEEEREDDKEGEEEHSAAGDVDPMSGVRFPMTIYGPTMSARERRLREARRQERARRKDERNSRI